MPISVQCSNCQHQYMVGDQFAGQRVKCKNCGNVFTIPTPAADPADPFAEASFESTVAAKPEEKKWNLPPVVPDDVAKTPPVARASGIATRRRRAARDPNAPVSNKFVPYILLLYTAITLVAGVFTTVIAYTHPDKPADPNASVGVLWGLVIAANVLLYAVHGPLMLAGVWGTTQILNTRMLDSAYWRACAVAAMPSVLVFFGLWIDSPLRYVVMLLIIPATLFAMKELFGFDWTGAAVAASLSIAGWVIGVILQIVTFGNITTVTSTLTAINGLMGTNHPATSDAPTASGGTPSTPDASTPTADSTFTTFRDKMHEKATGDLTLVTREDREPDVIEAKRELDLLRPRYGKDAEWPDVEKDYTDYAAKIAKRPSGVFDPATFNEPSEPFEDLYLGKSSRSSLGEEISYKQFKFQPPLAMKLDLNSSESAPEGLVWIGISNPQAKVSVFSKPRVDPKQIRPIIAHDPAILNKAELKHYFAIDSANWMEPKFCRINDVPFIRLSTNPGPNGEHTEQYIGSAGDSWIFVQLVFPKDIGSVAKPMQICPGTIRQAEADEARVDPFAASRVAWRLVDEFDRVSAILRHDPAAGEAALIPLLTGPDIAMRARALQVLKDIATTKSLPALLNVEALTSKPEADNAAAARAIVARLGNGDGPTANPAPGTPNGGTPPANNPVLTQLIANLDSKDAGLRKDAVNQLTLIVPDDAQQAAVSGKLAGILRSKDPAVPILDTITALCAWAGPSTANDLSSLLDEHADEELRHAAMKVLGSPKTASAAPAVARWVLKDPDKVAETLVAMGPGVEDVVTPLLFNRSAVARLTAAHILSRIGTKKSVPGLTHASTDNRDAGARDAAKLALATVRARLDAESPKPNLDPK